MTPPPGGVDWAAAAGTGTGAGLVLAPEAVVGQVVVALVLAALVLAAVVMMMPMVIIPVPWAVAVAADVGCWPDSMGNRYYPRYRIW